MVVLDRRKLAEAILASGHTAEFDGNVLVVKATLENGTEAELTCELGPSSQYSFPALYANLAKCPALRGLAHVGPHGKICVYDPVTNFPDPKRPEDALNEVLDMAIANLNDALTGRCDEDYQDEITAYWFAECSGKQAYVFDSHTASISRMYGAYPKVLDGPLCVASSKKRAAGFASRFGQSKVAAKDTFSCLLLKLALPMTYPFPQTATEWDAEIARSGKHASQAYRDFVASRGDKASTVILSCPAGDGRALLCFTQDSIESSDGFRKGSKLFVHATSNMNYGNQRVVKRHAENTSQERLFTRGGCGVVMDGKYAIVGCGSLGSHIARALADAGAPGFVLVDSECLAVENVARHACGFESIGMEKAAAVKRLLESGNPNIECDAFYNDVNVLIDSKPIAFDGTSAIFVTTADIPTEYHIVRSFSEGRIDGPVAILWLEPFVLAAHAIVLNKPQDVFRDLFDAEYRFTHSAVANGDAFFEREAGCQSTYVPYASLDVQSFVIDFLRKWPCMTADPRRNYLFTWIGHLSGAGSVGANVSASYRQSEDYTCRIERID